MKTYRLERRNVVGIMFARDDGLLDCSVREKSIIMLSRLH